MELDYDRVDANLFCVENFLKELSGQKEKKYCETLAPFFLDMVENLRVTFSRCRPDGQELELVSLPESEQPPLEPKPKKRMKRSTRIKLSKAMKKYQAKKRKANGVYKRTPEQRRNLSNAMTASHKRRAGEKKKGK